MIATPPAVLERRAQRLAAALGMPGASVAPTRATIGGGSLPEETIPSWALALRSKRASADALAAALRHAQPPVIGRIDDDWLLLDLRTVAPEQDDAVLAAVRGALPRH
jgi:L-seryl-tRNA(Ser) seleniumtransferase